ncbi:hypothetical protein MVES1_001022 [Malassezia vespertilionis]|uniref:Uncharacterized protein n=1 Tax=Malassezia vespertilionis TaxID=2020962 RepID=A0A2N1JFB9_9BASI|nr:uncharacterized protein MVES1_001022 [Malassezia vespertilionis]PKI85253.1 hypothetical protein MVES_000963 [Malassezia vespertilionis]WFD05690.1 hypothetical protein MVES1_001022 [Malassezia vespertilionis]
MALLTSDGAAKLADKGRQSEVSISCITLSQNITINVGDERIAYEIQADAEVQCLETAQALPLLAAPRGLSLTESAVRITAAPENMEILNPFCVSKIGNVYTLTVPSAWEQEDAMLQISIKLYFSTVVRRSRSTLAYYTQIPVLLSVKNSLKCTFHGFEGSPDAPPTLGTEPPMSCLPIWSTLNGMMQLQGTFPSTDILALQWGQPVEQGSEPPMFGNAALCECSMDIALERVWSEAYHDYALRSTLTFQFEVTIATPRVSLLVKESILYCELDGTDEELVLDSLEIEADSSIIARHELSVTTELDMNSKALVRVAGRVSNAPRKFALVVNVDAVCGMFGDPPASPLRFCKTMNINLKLPGPNLKAA